MTLYRFVDAQRAEGFPVRLVCSVVEVSASAYYAYRKRPQASPARLAEAALVDEIRAIWAESGETYGSPRVCAELRRRGRVVNHKRVERLMKRHHMAGFVPRKRRVTTTADSAHRRPDLLRGDFGASAPDVAWVGDISYIRTRHGFLYLAFVLDLASRRVVGVSMAPTPQSYVGDGRAPRSDRYPGRPGAGGGVPHRPRLPIHLGGHRPALPGVWHPPVGGPDRGVLGQRRRRVVPRNPQERTRQPQRLPQPAPGPPINPMVDRSLVQPPPASLHDRTAATERMGGQLLPSHGRINQVSSTRGELHLFEQVLAAELAVTGSNELTRHRP